jgi:hypothetical protein
MQARGIPWTLPDIDDSGVFISACASIQNQSNLPAFFLAKKCRETPDTLPIAREWSPPSTSGKAVVAGGLFDDRGQPAARLGNLGQVAGMRVYRRRGTSSLHNVRRYRAVFRPDKIAGLGRWISIRPRGSHWGPMSTPRRPAAPGRGGRARSMLCGKDASYHCDSEVRQWFVVTIKE